MITIGKISLTLTETIFILLIIITSGYAEQPTTLINEVMSSNSSTIEDEDGDYSDWIELYNPGDSHVNLTGYGLSDRPDNPYKWIFPTVILEPNQYLLVFASGKDRTTVGKQWETVITQGDDWKYFLYEFPNFEKWMYINRVEKEWGPLPPTFPWLDQRCEPGQR